MGFFAGWNSRKELIAHLLEPRHSENGSVTVAAKPIAHCCVGNNLWSVWEQVKTTVKNVTLAPGIEAPKTFTESYRWINVDLMARGGHPADWGYKPVSEDMGPCEVSCPLKYLEMAPLNEHHGEYAGPWRERVRAYWARRQRDLGKDLVDGQAFKANGNDYVYRPWTPGYRVYRGYIIGERNSCRYRVLKADVELPVPATEMVGVALVAEGGQANEKPNEA